jgi:drug/metabolite transporter (DMT)-like permease
MPALNNSKILIVLSFFTIYVIWGSTYLFVAYAVEEIPPFLLSGVRYAAASAILIGIAALLKQFKDVTFTQIKNSIFAGVLLLGFGSSGVAWALQRLDSGITALLIASQPLVTLLMMWAINQQKPQNTSFFGVFLGLVGAYLLLSQDIIFTTTEQWISVAIIFTALVIWAYATIFINKRDLPKAFMVNSGLQLLTGGTLSLTFSAMIGEEKMVWSELSSFGWLYLFILIVFGGALVYVAFNYLLKQTSPDKVATSTYVNPVIALFLGWWFRNELVTTQSLIAAAIMLLGVVFVNFKWETIKGFVKRVIGFFNVSKRQVNHF